ncbi:MAG: 3-dehydroquinate synthase [Gemmatimonadota bacterium]
MVRVHVSVPDAAPADYDVVVEAGALDRVDALVADVLSPPHFAVIADATVAERFGEEAVDALERTEARVDLLTFPPGEASKTRAQWSALTDALVERRFGRDGCIVALGGGVTGDLAGFVAATYMRGVPFIQLPTTLLAMIDASVGGKTGVDAAGGKNLVGAFHQPRLVIADPQLLVPLPDEAFRAGLAEAVKHGAIADPDYLREIERDAEHLLDRDAGALSRMIRRSVAIKAEFVTADPHEAGARQALNFGHTIGHALEAATAYETPHGHAVAVGMVVEAALGEALRITAPGTARMLAAALDRLGLPAALPDGVDAEAVLRHTRSDKKARDARVRYTLLARTGVVARSDDGAWTVPVEDELVLAILARRPD